MVTSSSADPDPRDERRFYTWISIAMATVVFTGFTRTFYLRAFFPEADSMAAPEPIFQVHGAVFSAWMCLLPLQALLIRTHKTKLHRVTGWLGIALASAVVVLGIYGSLIAAQRPGGFIGVPLPPLQFLAVPLCDMFLFGLFVMLAVVWRKNAASHKRLMILATVNLIEAAIIRIPVGFIVSGAPFASRGLSYLFIVAIAVWDFRSAGKIHGVTLWGGLAIILSFPIRLLVSETEAWTRFAGWAVQWAG